MVGILVAPSSIQQTFLPDVFVCEPSGPEGSRGGEGEHGRPAGAGGEEPGGAGGS